MEKLTREYFEENGYDINNVEFEGHTYWEAKLTKHYEKGDNIYANVVVTNLMYPEEFNFTGQLGNNFNSNFLIIKSVEDLNMIYKLARVNYNKEENKWLISNL